MELTYAYFNKYYCTLAVSMMDNVGYYSLLCGFIITELNSVVTCPCGLNTEEQGLCVPNSEEGRKNKVFQTLKDCRRETQ